MLSVKCTLDARGLDNTSNLTFSYPTANIIKYIQIRLEQFNTVSAICILLLMVLLINIKYFHLSIKENMFIRPCLQYQII